ncbi:hypothetical protein [Stenotrophomonas maltophilia]|uniref:hypothetical protein n=1 Tax=Stenotrophomonas maltophilia TaxID=40324 RepID=UPI00069E5E71|nr:hypothetical protein [Stenotrophomonas maltophilia]
MSNDIKTLENVQPGGMVRLGDALPPLPASSAQCLTTGAPLFSVEKMKLYALAALSAKPFPGGQDALAEAARRVISDVDSGDYGGTISMATYDALVSALAARQPVGEPVAWMTHHDEPMLFPTAAEAADYCEDDEQPVPLFRSPTQPVDLVQEPMFYIQDTRQFVGNCPVWWAPNGGGYVTRLDEAGRYTEQEAVKKNRTRDTDIPWPCAEIDAIARPTVDFQHMRPRAERLAELALIDSHSAGGQP